MNQHESVVSTIHALFGVQKEKYELTTEQRAQVIDEVTESILEGVTEFSAKAKAKYHTPKLVREYVSGMVSNWLRKSPHLNGGVKYQPKNPGSRVGSQDDLVKNLKLLIKSGKLSPEQEQIAQANIDKRVQEIKLERNKVDINYDAIPDDLLATLGIEE